VKIRQAFRVGPPPTWEWDDLPFRYAAPIAAWTVDRSSWELWSEDGKLVAPPSGYGLTIRHRRQTGTLSSNFDPWSKTLELNGALRAERFRVGAFALPDPDRAAASFFGGRFAKFEGDLPASAPALELQSPPISSLIKDCLEPSDNIYAEHLLLLAAGKDKPLSADAYSEAGGRMKEFFVSQVALAPTDLRPVDGSGLSRQNLVTPLALAKVLRWADRQPWGPQFVEGLAAPGEGTLTSRLKTVKFAGKTGTINAVSSLSGIIRPGEATRLYISIVFNSAIASASALRALQDEIVSSVEKSGNNEHPQSPADSPDGYAHAGHRALDVRWLP
jgi:D-alanyl-D-alanine carboxypeptidase/D-alanyl-D-alanine-endopeptidase (penicillin-binding protein 4)